MFGTIRYVLATMALFSMAGAVSAVDYLQDKAEVKNMLSAHKLEGLYLRTQSAYMLQFNKDGTLKNQRGESGRWWVSDKGQYCREWESGRLKGHQICLELAKEADKIAIYSKGKKVAEGKLVPIQ